MSSDVTRGFFVLARCRPGWPWARGLRRGGPAGGGQEAWAWRRRCDSLRTGAFSNAYCVDVGDAVIIHVAGHLAIDAGGQVVGGADTARQAEHIYGVIERLPAAGATMDDVVKTTAYLTDVRDYPAVNQYAMPCSRAASRRRRWSR